MAEAAVQSPNTSRFICHNCTQEIYPVLPQYTCSRCQSRFIEQLAQGSDGNISEESDENSEPVSQVVEFRNMVDALRRRDLAQNHGTSTRYDQHSNCERSALLSGPSYSRRNDRPGSRQVVIRQVSVEIFSWCQCFVECLQQFIFMHAVLSIIVTMPLYPDAVTILALTIFGGFDAVIISVCRQFFVGFLQYLRPMLAVLRTIVPLPGYLVSLTLLSNPGDFAWGRGGFVAIVTRLLNQVDGTGPPPLSKDKIEKIPSVLISQDQIDKNLQCTVCIEDFVSGEPVKKLSCEHHFHRDCIAPWLELHGTCPNCRKLLNDDHLPHSESSSSGFRHSVLRHCQIL